MSNYLEKKFQLAQFWPAFNLPALKAKFFKIHLASKGRANKVVLNRLTGAYGKDGNLD